jgi:class 3 adenylate cyclase
MLPVGCVFGDTAPERTFAEARAASGTEVEARIRRAAAACMLHELDKALEEYDQAADAALATGRHDAYALCLVGKALTYYEKTAFDAAQRAIDRIKSKPADRNVAAAVLLARAKLASRASRHVAADADLKAAHELLMRPDIGPDELALATEAYILTGQSLLRQEKLADAVTAYREAGTLAEQRRYAMGLARSFRGQGVVRSMERNPDAFLLHRRSLAHYEECGHPLGQVMAHVSLGRNYFSAGELEQADFHYREAERICATHKIVQAQGETQARLGDVRVARGEYQAALETYRRARALLPVDAELRSVGLAQRDIGRAERLLGNMPAAERELLASLESFTKCGARSHQAYTLLELARAYVDGGRAADAFVRVREARDIFREADRATEMAMADLVEGMAHRATGEFERAKALLLKAKQVFEAREPSFRLAEIHYELSLLDEAQGDREATLRSLHQAIRYARLTKAMDLEIRYLQRLSKIDLHAWMKTAYEVLVVAPDEYEKMLRGGGRAATSVTTLFVDIRGYTTLAEKMAGEPLAELINEYLDLMSRAALKHEGRVVDFYGDGMLAVFGLDGPDRPANAVKAALAMLDVIPMLNERKKSVLPKPIAVGIGIHAGRVVAGFFGSQQRKKFTVIGDPVNVASRLSANAGAGEILVSGGAWERVKDEFKGESRGPLQVKGRAEAVETTRVVRSAR